MFEYLMPNLVMPSYENTPLWQTSRATVKRQIEYGGQRDVPWGISESGYNMVDANLSHPSEHRPGLFRVARRAVHAGSRQLHGTEAHPVNLEAPEANGSCCGHREQANAPPWRPAALDSSPDGMPVLDSTEKPGEKDDSVAGRTRW